MLTASAKAKGRRLQQRARDAVFAKFPELEPGDLRSTTMGMHGADLQPSPKADEVLGRYFVECKNVERIRLWQVLQDLQERSDEEDAEPILIFSRNNSETYVTIRMDHWLDLSRAAYDHRRGTP